MGNLQGMELLLLVVLALVILGPDRLPEYAAKLARGVRQLRDLAEGARSQLKEEMGPGFDDVDWKQLDPRQYDPRRIVREALTTADTDPDDEAAADETRAHPRPARGRVPDPGLPTPFDTEAT